MLPSQKPKGILCKESVIVLFILLKWQKEKESRNIPESVALAVAVLKNDSASVEDIVLAEARIWKKRSWRWRRWNWWRWWRREWGRWEDPAWSVGVDDSLSNPESW